MIQGLKFPQDCEAANPLQAPKPRKIQSRSKNRSKVGFLEIRKVGRKIGPKGFCAESLFLTTFRPTFRPTFRIPRKPTFDLFSTYFDFFGVSGLVGGSPLHNTKRIPDSCPQHPRHRLPYITTKFRAAHPAPLNSFFV